ncbi:thiol-disulfide oxidoreductase [Planctomycetes bacterium Pan216]|uniref:Thiol-disulfide oxidoreductase n=1 Tax=Kolteria novifilia TaxID=2527975 RepID=A0A518B6A9_9BACT|nr:thiol-disulfide oxidoreductase [Planctomycetes bacterium Pan216]
MRTDAFASTSMLPNRWYWAIGLAAIVVLLSGCASNRFQLANEPVEDTTLPVVMSELPSPRAGGGLNPPAVRVPASPSAPAIVPGVSAGAAAQPVAPPVGSQPVVSTPAVVPGIGIAATGAAMREPKLTDNPRPNDTGVLNRRVVGETPRPGAPGSKLEPATDGPELSGIVVDEYGRPAPLSSIQVVDLSKRAITAELASGSDGRFKVRNLCYGTSYELIAMTSSYGRRLRGSVIAKPPDAAVYIQVTTNGTGVEAPSTGNQVHRQPVRPAPRRSAFLAAAPSAGRLSVQTPVMLRSIEPLDSSNAPRQFAAKQRPRPATNPWTPIRDDSAPKELAASVSKPQPPAAIEEPVTQSVRHVEPVVEEPAPRQKAEETLDADLVLIDFFGSWCIPCRQSVPKLNSLHRRYSPTGLKVVGIACEWQEVDEAGEVAAAVRRDMGIEYSVVATSMEDAGTPRQRFQVTHYPTLVLLDREGTVLFRSNGCDAKSLAKLDRIIARNLSGVAKPRRVASQTSPLSKQPAKAATRSYLGS